MGFERFRFFFLSIKILKRKHTRKRDEQNGIERKCLDYAQHDITTGRLSLGFSYLLIILILKQKYAHSIF